MAKLEIPVIVECTEIDELIDEIKHLQTYKLFEGDEQVLIDRDDTIEIFAKHIRASVQPEQTEQRWKLCKDQFPPRNGLYRVTFNDGTMGFCEYDEGCWWMVARFKWSKYDDIKAWYKPPEPYREEQDE